MAESTLTLDATIRKEWHIEVKSNPVSEWRLAWKAINESIARDEVKRLNGGQSTSKYQLVEVSIHTSRKMLE